VWGGDELTLSKILFGRSEGMAGCLLDSLTKYRVLTRRIARRESTTPDRVEQRPQSSSIPIWTTTLTVEVDVKNVPQPMRLLLRPMWMTAKSILNKLHSNLLDYYDSLRGKRNPLVPPRSMGFFVGDGDYEKIGNEFFEYFTKLGKLKPTDRVLDVGCGIGRMSVPLTQYLAEGGEYYGFDIVKMGIDWCNGNIASRYPNFHFNHADIYNTMYNPNGKEKSSEYVFIYESNFFDFVFLTSVFTHMLAPDVRRYLSEISRVMKNGSKCLMSCFLMNEEANVLIQEGRSTQKLVYPIDDNSFTKDKNVPESAVGYREEYFKMLCNESRLRIDGEIYYGKWCGRGKYKSYQDIVIAQKY
jgi:SAM-dependent methyltransferase